MIIAVLAELSGTVGSGVSGSGVSAFLTGSAARTRPSFFSVVAPLAGVTSVSFLPTLVVFCVISFAFVCSSLSCVVSWVFGATTFSSALVVVAEAGIFFANFNSFSLSLLLPVLVAGSANELSLLF